MIINQIAAGSGGGVKFVNGSYVIEEATNTFEITGLPFEPTGFALVCSTPGGTGTGYSAEYVTGDNLCGDHHALSFSGGSRRGQEARVTFGADSLKVLLISYNFYKNTTMRYYIWSLT